MCPRTSVLLTVLTVMNLFSVRGAVASTTESLTRVSRLVTDKETTKARELLNKAMINAEYPYQVSWSIFEDAHLDYQLANYVSAIAKLRQFLTRFPNDPWSARALNLLGYSYLKNKQYGEAIAMFNSFIEKFPDHDNTPEAALRVVRLREKIETGGKTGDLMDMYKNIMQKYPGTNASKEATKSYVNLYWLRSEESGLPEEKQALLDFVQSLKLSASNDYDSGYAGKWEAAALIEYQRFAKRFGELDQIDYNVVIESCNQALELSASDDYAVVSTILLIKGECLYENRNYSEALRVFSSIISKFENKGECEKQVAYAVFMTGLALRSTQELVLAEEAFTSVTTVYDKAPSFANQPVQSAALIQLILLKIDALNFSEVEILCDTLLTISSDPQTVLFADNCKAYAKSLKLQRPKLVY